MTQLGLFAEPVERPWVRYWVPMDSRGARGGFAAVEGRLRKAQARRSLTAVGLTRTQQAQSWLRAARWWPAGSRQREDFKGRAMWLIGQEVTNA